MRFIADLHIHSHYSLATSKQLTPEWIDYWARLKGIGLVATGDFTHRKWTAELREKLVDAGNGLFMLNPAFQKTLPVTLPGNDAMPPRFVLSAEISSIYKKNGKVRKVHSLIYAPGFETIEKIQQSLANIGNIDSDGRPILGFDAADLLKLVKDIDPDVHFIPAHIWTPWFSVLGDKSGFNTIEECFGDLTSEITALETGLSTDVPLNWMCSFLDRFSLVSDSDAHSPDRLGRNANVFDCDFSYHQIFSALKNQDEKLFKGTIDLYPQEGKYHYDGHRKCNICWNPVETLRNRGICSVCGRPVVIGVANRIARISDRTDITERAVKMPFRYIIPLPELLGEITGTSENSKQTKELYVRLLQQLGCEFDILLWHPLGLIEQKAGTVLCEAIRRMRSGEVILHEGYDGEYGAIKVFSENENRYTDFHPQQHAAEMIAPWERPLLRFDLKEYHRLKSLHYELVAEEKKEHQKNGDNPLLTALNDEQRIAVTSGLNSILVIAGPGTGKTAVLTTRIAWLITMDKADPQKILALTFTQKAASEMKKRLAKIPGLQANDLPFTGTFHAFGLFLIKKWLGHTGRKTGFTIIDETEQELVCTGMPGVGKSQVKKILQAISLAKQNFLTPEEVKDVVFSDLFRWYENKLLKYNLFDFDDLIYVPYLSVKNSEAKAEELKTMTGHILVDEFQDLNPMQYLWLKQLINPQVNVFAIGDPDQSVYGFRGANPAFLKTFSDDYPGTSIYRLKTSYRCPERILKASGQVIGHDTANFLKGISKGVKISIVPHTTDQAEAGWIARTISELLGGLDFYRIDSATSPVEADSDINSLSDIAILCRTHSLMDFYAGYLRQKGIPVKMATDRKYVDDRDLKIIMDIFRYVQNNRPAFIRIKLMKWGINPENVPSDNAAGASQLLDKILQLVIPESVENPWVEQLKQVCQSNRFTVTELIEYIQTGGLTGLWEIQPEHINLLTLHASKGLEFKCVFIPACEDTLVPYRHFKGNTDMDEERRLLYVGMTRAEKRLFISHAFRRRYKGQEMQNQRSPFLDAIESELIETLRKQHKRTKDDPRQLSLF